MIAHPPHPPLPAHAIPIWKSIWCDLARDANGNPRPLPDNVEHAVIQMGRFEANHQTAEVAEISARLREFQRSLGEVEDAKWIAAGGGFSASVLSAESAWFEYLCSARSGNDCLRLVLSDCARTKLSTLVFREFFTHLPQVTDAFCSDRWKNDQDAASIGALVEETFRSVKMGLPNAKQLTGSGIAALCRLTADLSCYYIDSNLTAAKALDHFVSLPPRAFSDRTVVLTLVTITQHFCLNPDVQETSPSSTELLVRLGTRFALQGSGLSPRELTYEMHPLVALSYLHDLFGSASTTTNDLASLCDAWDYTYQELDRIPLINCEKLIESARANILQRIASTTVPPDDSTINAAARLLTVGTSSASAIGKIYCSMADLPLPLRRQLGMRVLSRLFETGDSIGALINVFEMRYPGLLPHALIDAVHDTVRGRNGVGCSPRNDHDTVAALQIISSFPLHFPDTLRDVARLAGARILEISLFWKRWSYRLCWRSASLEDPNPHVRDAAREALIGLATVNGGSVLQWVRERFKR